ncbi:hisS, partial [Symbiodinium sp. CCMP2456]
DKLFDAVSAINEVAKDLQRRLQTEECSDGVDLTDAHNIAQIIQGAGFMALAMWLIFANNSKVAVAQKAPLEQRHAICATISTAVALFSGFFNILQLTAIDDFDLPGRENNFTLNLSRPIEWIATCPIMQLKLVVLAGSRVPSYRRFMMPLISVAVLLC